MIKRLPRELKNKIYKRYFSDHVLNLIKPKCFYNFKLYNNRFRKQILDVNFNNKLIA